MSREEAQEFLDNLPSTVTCRCCHVTVLRQEIGSHYRTNSHIANHRRFMIRGLYQRGMQPEDIYAFAAEYKQKAIDERIEKDKYAALCKEII